MIFWRTAGGRYQHIPKILTINCSGAEGRPFLRVLMNKLTSSLCVQSKPHLSRILYAKAKHMLPPYHKILQFVTIRLDNVENQSSGWLLREPTVRAKCVEVGTRINMTQCVNDHPFVEPSVCGDTHVCLYNTSDVTCVTHVFCVTPFGSVMCHLPITSLQRLMTKS